MATAGMGLMGPKMFQDQLIWKLLERDPSYFSVKAQGCGLFERNKTKVLSVTLVREVSHSLGPNSAHVSLIFHSWYWSQMRILHVFIFPLSILSLSSFSFLSGQRRRGKSRGMKPWEVGVEKLKSEQMFWKMYVRTEQVWSKEIRKGESDFMSKRFHPLFLLPCPGRKHFLNKSTVGLIVHAAASDPDGFKNLWYQQEQSLGVGVGGALWQQGGPLL